MRFEIGEAEIGLENGAYALRGVCSEASVPGAFLYGMTEDITHENVRQGNETFCFN